MLDSNVAHLYFQPTKEVASTRALPKSLKSSVDNFIAIISAHFIFEGALPGRGRIKTFMDAGHIEEFTAQIQRARDELHEGSAALSKETATRLRKDLVRFDRAISLAKLDDRKLAKTADTWFRKIFETYGIEGLGAYRLLHDLIYKRDQMYPLPLGPYFRGLDISNPDPALVEVWSKALENEVGPDLHKPRNLMTDAVCLARIETINKYLRDHGTSARYVLLTTDTKILRAARRRQPDDPDGPQGPIVRSARQYIPLGNIHDMDNFIGTTRGTDAIEQAIDSHFALEEVHPRDRDRRLDWLHEIATALAKRFREKDVDPEFQRRNRVLLKYYFDLPDTETTMDRIRSVWTQLIENSVNLNKNLILDHYQLWMEGVQDILQKVSLDRQRSVGKYYEQTQLDAAGKLACAHIYITLSYQIFSNLESARTWSRLGLGVRLDTGNQQSGPHAIAERIIGALASGQERDIGKQLSKLTKNPQDPQQVILASAAIALQCGLWNVAIELADLVVNEKVRDPGPTETLIHCRANLIYALAKRALVMSSTNEEISQSAVSDERLRVSLRRVADDLKRLEYDLEASIAHAEIAWTYLFEAFREPNKKIDESTSDKIILEIGKCFDFSDTRTGRRINDFTGKDIRTIVQARAGAALLFLILQFRSRDQRIPASAWNWLKFARGALGKISRGGDRQNRNQLWALLWEISKRIKPGFKTEDIADGLPGLENYLLLKDDDVVSGFPVERQFIWSLIQVPQQT
nr:hypothetical protein [uncultured Roseibium sp.]